jgi:hypothetical protein
MKKKHRGFTLPELLVALLCGMLVLGMLTGAAIFLTKGSNKLLGGGRELFQTKAAYDYICSLNLTDCTLANNVFSVEDGALIHNGVEILEDTALEQVVFTSKDGFVYCELTYTDRPTLSFVAGKE